MRIGNSGQITPPLYTVPNPGSHDYLLIFIHICLASYISFLKTLDPETLLLRLKHDGRLCVMYMKCVRVTAVPDETCKR